MTLFSLLGDHSPPPPPPAEYILGDRVGSSRALRVGHWGWAVGTLK